MGEWITEAAVRATRPRAGGADCVFCELIRTDSANWVAREDLAVAFLPLPDSVIAAGQTLVVPRAHCANGVLDVDPQALAATMSLVQRVSQAMVSELGASGVCVLNASGPNSGRSIDHLHFHVVPRYPEDGEDCLPWPSARSRHLVEGDARSLLARAMAPLTVSEQPESGTAATWGGQ